MSAWSKASCALVVRAAALATSKATADAAFDSTARENPSLHGSCSDDDECQHNYDLWYECLWFRRSREQPLATQISGGGGGGAMRGGVRRFTSWAAAVASALPHTPSHPHTSTHTHLKHTQHTIHTPSA
ncbi:hypothetical protein T492DRAFT_1139033 [Pavlovales sp. CCMP2436]|nr:hypothetical protein T492DRAFT_1139033 [Pavlovales sp. CCMP2436]